MIDLIGQKFGKLNVVGSASRRVDSRGRGLIYWKCTCDCGGDIELGTAVLRSGNTKSCGCIHKKEDLVGRKYGKLTILEKLDARYECANKKSTFWKCQCDCGKIAELPGRLMLSGNTKSCGCYHREFKITHGKSRGKSRAYTSWADMKARCLNPNSEVYNYYGGRGILICDEWLKFENFISDMGEPPTPTHTLDRKNTNGNYEPSNCRWATKEEQSNNTRRSLFVEYNNQRKTVAQWARIIKMPAHKLRAKYWKGEMIFILSEYFKTQEIASN